MATLTVRRRVCLFVGSLFACTALLPPALPAGAQVEQRASTVQRYAETLRSFNRAFSELGSRDMAKRVLLLSSYYDLDARLLVAIVGVESGWNSGAVSPAGAEGLGQLMPSTASGLAVQPFEALENLDGTARYLRRLLHRYARSGIESAIALSLAGYNAGPAAVARFGGIPPYAETRAYVSRVVALWHRLRGELPATGGFGSVVARTHVPQHRNHISYRASRAIVADFVRLDSQSLGVPIVVAVRTVPIVRRRMQETPTVFSPPFHPAPAPTLQAAPTVYAPPFRPAVAEHVVAVTHVASAVQTDQRVESIALSAPQLFPEVRQIPVTLRVRGSGKVRIVAKIGPTVIDQIVVPAGVRHIFLRRLPKTGRSRLVTVRAFAQGTRSPDATVVTVPYELATQ